MPLSSLLPRCIDQRVQDWERVPYTIQFAPWQNEQTGYPGKDSAILN